jgi:precorrin-6B methylase 1
LSGCGDSAKDQLDEAVTGKDKIAAGVGAAVEAELGIVAAEVASWYTLDEGDPKVVTSGGSYYICAAAEADCVANGTVISGASSGIQIALARAGQDWCLQATADSKQYHTGPGDSPTEGPC